MKKIWMYLFFLPLFACDDFLTVESENDVTYYSYFKTEQDVEAVITTMMAMEIDMWGSVMNVDVFDIAALPCDEYWNEDQRNLALTAFSIMEGVSWGGYYSIIGHADLLIDNSFRFGGMTEERKEFWLAQANFIKALCYFNIARNWNRLEKSYNGVDFQTYGDAGYFDSNVSIIGKPLNGLYVYKDKGYYNSDDEVPFIFENGQKIYLHGNGYRQFYRAGDRIMVDVDGNGAVYTSWPLQEDRVYAGSPLPKASGGIISTLNWKGFDVNMLFTYVISRHILNAGKGASVGTSLGLTMDDLTIPVFADLDKVTFWQKPGDKTDFPMNRLESGLGNFSTILSSNVENVNYLKLKTLTIGYTFPKEWMSRIGMESARVFVSGENLFTITNYSGPDPESVDVVTGVDNFGNYPLSTRITIGLTLNF